jgi:hypothetical protein
VSVTAASSRSGFGLYLFMAITGFLFAVSASRIQQQELGKGMVCACRTKWSFIPWMPVAAVGRVYDGCQL